MGITATSPVSDTDVVLGKFTAGLGLMVVLLILTMYYPLLLYILGGAPDTGPIWASYLGLLLLGSAAISIGIFFSSLTNNQIISVVVSGGTLAALWGMDTLLLTSPRFSTGCQLYFFKSNFNNFNIGIIDSRSVIYYLTITVLFLYWPSGP